MTKIAINGLGRIGRSVLKVILSGHPDLELVAINDLADPSTLAYLLKYDSVYGLCKHSIELTGDNLSAGGSSIKVFSEKDPTDLAWKKLGVDIVLECTGVFRDLEGAGKHIKAGAKKVIISAPAKSEGIPSFVLGVNEDKFDSKKDKIVDMGSCTTNCLAPVVKVLDDEFGVVKGFMTTIHSYTTDQRILDLAHKKDLRRGRAAALNMIPTTTGATKAIGKVIPKLEGKLDGMSIRVPTPTVSLIDLVCELKKETTAEEINYTFKKASGKDSMQGILGIEDTPLVSSDYIGNSFSSVVDALSTKVNGNMVKVLSWYDNEYAYACRMVEFAEYIGKRL